MVEKYQTDGIDMKDYTEKLPETKDMNEFFNQLIENHLRIMKKTPDLNPLWLLLLIKGRLEIMNIINATKQSPNDQIAKIIKLKKPDAYIFFSEAWAKTMSKEQMKKVKYGDVAKDPKRRECLTVIGRSIDGLHEIKKLFWIKRDGKNISFQEDKHGDKMTVRKLP